MGSKLVKRDAFQLRNVESLSDKRCLKLGNGRPRTYSLVSDTILQVILCRNMKRSIWHSRFVDVHILRQTISMFLGYYVTRWATAVFCGQICSWIYFVTDHGFGYGEEVTEHLTALIKRCLADLNKKCEENHEFWIGKINARRPKLFFRGICSDISIERRFLAIHLQRNLQSLRTHPPLAHFALRISLLGYQDNERARTHTDIYRMLFRVTTSGKM
jgi:hypothetical protein